MAVPRSVRARAEALRRLLDHHGYLYYVLDAPSVSDAEAVIVIDAGAV